MMPLLPFFPPHSAPVRVWNIKLFFSSSLSFPSLFFFLLLLHPFLSPQKFLPQFFFVAAVWRKGGGGRERKAEREGICQNFSEPKASRIVSPQTLGKTTETEEGGSSTTYKGKAFPKASGLKTAFSALSKTFIYLFLKVLELQNTLDDLTSRVDGVKEENLRLRSENSVLGQYIENLMQASAVFQVDEYKVHKSPNFSKNNSNCKQAVQTGSSSSTAAAASSSSSSSSSSKTAAANKGLGSVIRSCAARTRAAVGGGGASAASTPLASAGAPPPLNGERGSCDEEDEDDDDDRPVVKGVLSS